MGFNRKASLVVAVVVVGLVASVPVGAWMLRGVIATGIARAQLTERGIDCDSRFSVSPNAVLSSATVAPTRCVREAGMLEAVELLGDFTVALDGTEPEAVEGGSLRLVLREAEVRGGDGWARSLSRIQLEQRMAAVVKALSELSQLGLPSVEVERVELVRGSASVGHARSVAITPSGDTLGFTFARAHFEAGPMGVGQLDLTGATGTASSGAVTLRGRAHARAGIAIFSIEREGAFGIEATGLDTASPRFRLSGDL